MLPVLALDSLVKCGVDDLIEESKVEKFFKAVQKGYREDVPYHNDLHGADVLQYARVFLMQNDLVQILNLSNLDCLSFLIAAVCHDLGHDGFTNGYHVNAVSPRAIDSNDTSV